jgi:acyl-CoA synthetase (NDP forming)
VLDVARQALAAGVRALCVISAGFREASAEGAHLEEELLALVRSYGARMIGPNCLGITAAPVRLNATFASSAIPLGDIGFCSQSGALGLALIEEAAERDLGLSSFVSVGNKADVSSNDLLEFWEEDEATKLILLYLESFGNPRKFGRLARRVARVKPILALHGGSSAAGARAAGSHTAALAASPDAVHALFRQAGVIQAESLEELIDTAALLTSQPLPAGRRVAILTNAGGLGVLCADACAAAGLALASLEADTLSALGELLPAPIVPANPLDVLGSAPPTHYGKAIEPLLDDPNVDAVIVLFAPPVSATSREVAAQLNAALQARAVATKPVLGVLFDDGSAREELRGTVTVFDFPGSAARALARAAARAEWLAEPAGVVTVPDGIDHEAALAVVATAVEGGDAWLDPVATHALLEAYGLPVAAQRVCATADDAVAAAQELGFPAVLKTALAGAHKTESGGIALGLASEQDVRDAFDRIGGPVLVQAQVTGGGAELLVGMLQDERFGPIVAAGPGGVLAELIADANLALAPLSDRDAERMLTRGRLGKLVAGFRGPALDKAALADLLVRVSQLAEDFPEVAELDLNPVLAGPDRIVAVDARVRVRPVEPISAARKTW